LVVTVAMAVAMATFVNVLISCLLKQLDESYSI